MRVTLDRPWLVADLGAPLRTLGWPLNRPGFATASRIAWRELRDADLAPGLDAAAWLAAELAARGLADAPAMLTSRDIGAHVLRRAEVEGRAADCLATVGLSNAERIGTRARPGRGLRGTIRGTINLALRLSTPLTDGALAEALSVAAEARTAAVIDAAPDRPGGRITGTGTDCILVAAPPGDGAFAGLHTPLGEAIGRAVYAAVRRGADDWWATFGRPTGYDHPA